MHIIYKTINCICYVSSNVLLMTFMSMPKYPCQGIVHLPLSLDIQTIKGV